MTKLETVLEIKQIFVFKLISVNVKWFLNCGLNNW